MTGEVRSPDCLDPETMAAYVDGRLDAPARAGVERHLADCEECYDRFSDMTAVARELSRPVGLSAKPRLRHSRVLTYFYLAAASVTLLLLAGPLVRSGLWRSRESANASLDELLAATSAHRPTLGRLSTVTNWAPVRSETRGGGASEPAPAVVIAAAKIEQALGRERSVPNLKAYATAQLTLGHPQNAVAALEEAVRVAPKDAASWSDLSAACYAQGDLPDAAASLARGLEAADVAVGLDGRSQTALFNKALLLERLNLRDQAVDAWNAYLKRDPDSSWATEARLRLARIRAQSSSSAPENLQVVRDRLFDEVLGRWGAAMLSADSSTASAALDDARQTLISLDVSPDTLSADVLAAIDTLPPTFRPAAAQGHSLYAQARDRYTQDDFEAAAPLFERASEAFDRAHSPALHLARLYLGILRYRARDNTGALAILRTLRADVGQKSYESVLGRALWTEGLVREAEGAAREAVSDYQAAISLLTAARETGNAAFVEALLASHFDHVGDSARAWQAIAAALSGTQREGALLTAAIMATSLNWHHVAFEYEVAAARAARASNRLPNLADALRWQAVTRARLGEIAEARRAIAEARTITSGNRGAAWLRIAAELDAADVMAPDVSSPAESIDAGTRAIAYFDGSGSRTRIPALMLARGSIYAKAGDLGRAVADLSEGLAVAAQLRRQVDTGVDQVTFADTLRGLIGGLVDVQGRQGRLRDAFPAIDDARGVDTSPVERSRPLSLSSLVAELQPGVTLAEFVVTDERTVVWVATSAKSSVVALPIGASKIAALTGLVSAPRFERAAAAELYRLLFAEVENQAPEGGLIVVVPDGPLHAVPLGALIESHGAYFIERHSILIAASARGFVDASKRLRAYDGPPRHVFVAGDAKVDAAKYPALPKLPFADDEAAAVAATYPDRVCLTGEAVTRQSVIDHLNTEVVHIAGHAIANSTRPLESEIVVWDPDGPGLRASAIRQADCRVTRAVVLSACRSAAGQITNSEGSIGLARAFLEAGAPSVVASRWDVDDRVTASLMTTFHAAFVKSGDAASALRQAQLALIRSKDPDFTDPRNWAAFFAIGGTPMRQ